MERVAPFTSKPSRLDIGGQRPLTGETASKARTMCGRSRNTILGPISVLALIAGGTVCFADAIDSRLVGAWAPSPSDCARLFQRRGGVLSYRQPVDKFAQGAIIEPQHILGPASTCRLRNVARARDDFSVSVECDDSISFSSQTVHIKMNSGTEIVYSPSIDQTLNTTLIKCRL